MVSKETRFIISKLAEDSPGYGQVRGRAVL